jgi:hypothetical protein
MYKIDPNEKLTHKYENDYICHMFSTTGWFEWTKGRKKKKQE